MRRGPCCRNREHRPLAVLVPNPFADDVRAALGHCIAQGEPVAPVHHVAEALVRHALHWPPRWWSEPTLINAAAVQAEVGVARMHRGRWPGCRTPAPGWRQPQQAAVASSAASTCLRTFFLTVLSCLTDLGAIASSLSLKQDEGVPEQGTASTLISYSTTNALHGKAVTWVGADVFVLAVVGALK